MKKLFQSEITKFVLKVLLIYVAWYIVYELWLLPKGTIDEPLSQNIASVSAGILTFLGQDVFFYERILGIADAGGIEIVDGCNGIAAIGLFIGFIYAYPGAWGPRILFSIFGIAVIYLVNVSRIVLLAYTQYHWPQAFDFTHDYSTTTIFYIAIFVLWMIWANYGETVGKSGGPETTQPVMA